METISSIYIVAGLTSTLIGMLIVLWRIAKSVTTTQISVAQIQRDITEIKIIIDKTDDRVDKLNEKMIVNQIGLSDTNRRLEDVIENCKEHRKAMLG